MDDRKGHTTTSNARRNMKKEDVLKARLAAKKNPNRRPYISGFLHESGIHLRGSLVVSDVLTSSTEIPIIRLTGILSKRPSTVAIAFVPPTDVCLYLA
jgi:hypothetical protein